MKKLNFIIICIIASFFISKLYSPKEIQKVEINEEITYLNFESNSLKEINNIDISDLAKVEISKKKFYDILEYKDSLGAISSVEELLKIPKFTDKDIQKLKKYFKDSENFEYKSININTASKQVLKYIGFSNAQANKILEYRNNEKIKSYEDLKNIVKNTDKIKFNIIFE